MKQDVMSLWLFTVVLPLWLRGAEITPSVGEVQRTAGGRSLGLLAHWGLLFLAGLGFISRVHIDFLKITCFQTELAIHVSEKQPTKITGEEIKKAVI